jgi:hypothetical protein
MRIHFCMLYFFIICCQTVKCLVCYHIYPVFLCLSFGMSCLRLIEASRRQSAIMVSPCTCYQAFVLEWSPLMQSFFVCTYVIAFYAFITTW